MKSGKRNSKPGHVPKGDIFDDLGFSPAETLEAKIKADIWQALMKHVEREGYSQTQLVAILRSHQPDISNLLMGKISKFSITKLIQFAGRLGLDASVKIKVVKVEKKAGTMSAESGKPSRSRRELIAA